MRSGGGALRKPGVCRVARSAKTEEMVEVVVHARARRPSRTCAPGQTSVVSPQGSAHRRRGSADESCHLREPDHSSSAPWNGKELERSSFGRHGLSRLCSCSSTRPNAHNCATPRSGDVEYEGRCNSTQGTWVLCKTVGYTSTTARECDGIGFKLHRRVGAMGVVRNRWRG